MTDPQQYARTAQSIGIHNEFVHSRGKRYLPDSSIHLVAALHLHEDLEAFQGGHSCPRPEDVVKRLLS